MALPTQEEREIIVRDKAAREGMTVPDEVVRYIAANRTSDTALKGALVDLAAYAYRRQMPITLQMAEYRLEGVRPGVNAKHAAQMTRETEPVSAHEISFGIDQNQQEKSAFSKFGLPSFLTAGTSPMRDALSDEGDIILEDVPQYQHIDDEKVTDVVAGGAIYQEVGLQSVEMKDLADDEVFARPEPSEEIPEPTFIEVATASPKVSEAVVAEQTFAEPAFVEQTAFAEPAFVEQTAFAEPAFVEPATVAEPAFTEPTFADELIEEPAYVEGLPDDPVYVPILDEEPFIVDEPAFSPIKEPLTPVSAEISIDDDPTATFEELTASMLGESLVEQDVVETPTLFDDAPIEVPMESFAAAEPLAAAPVYFAPMKTNQKRSFVERAGIALQKAGLEDVIEEGDIVAIKVHVGEQGNTAFVSPIYVREVVSLVKELGGKPFLTDANTLYSGQRKNAVDHVACAIHNGFSYATVEAPFIVADGLLGNSWTEVRVDGKHCESVRMGSAAVEADAMVVVSHVKGHGVAGFGGAIKNLGMGLGSRAAKQRMHSDVLPQVNEENCTHCYKCIKWCPVSAITIDPESRAAVIDHDVCYGCGECVAACNYEAIAISWEGDPNDLQEKMVEHAAGIIDGKPEKMIYLSFLTNITPECDCWSFSDAPIVGDIGLLASRDMVAIDQASYDLVVEAVGSAGSDGAGMAAGADKFREISGTDGTRAIAYGEEFGLGTRRYELITIG